MIRRHVQELRLWPVLLFAMLHSTLALAGGVDLLELPAKKSRAAARALLLDVAVAGNRLVAVGERGIVIFSDDGGGNWVQADVPVSVMLTGVYFVNDRKGWAVGHDGVILHSDDGGRTWTRQFDGNKANALVLADAEARVKQARQLRQSGGAGARQRFQTDLEHAESSLEEAVAGAKFGPSRPLLGVWFRNEAEGYAVGSYGQIFRTRDGGKNWDSLGTKLNNPDGLHYNAITGTSTGELFIAGEAGKVYRSFDGGSSWRTLDTGYKGQLYGVCRLESVGGEILLAYGFGGRIFRSVNRGRTWGQVGAGLKTVPLVGAVMLSPAGVVVAGQDGTLLRSDDAGKTFAIASPPRALPVSSVVAIPDRSAMALAGFGGVHVVPLITTGAGAGTL
jgi:photosystem II stability/assembly factor-like uncharacterized protein